MPLLVLFYFGGDVGARANQTHIAAQNIVKLRHLIQTQFANQPPHARAARIVLDLEQGAVGFVHIFQSGFLRFCILHHRAEFVDAKGLAFFTHALLIENNRSRRFQFDSQRNQGHQRRDDDQSSQGNGKINGALDKQVDPADRGVFGANQGDTGYAGEVYAA